MASAETCRKSAPFRAGYPPLVRALSAPLQGGLRLLRLSSTPSVITLPCGRASVSRRDEWGAYPVARGGDPTGAAAPFRPAGVGVTVASGAIWRSDPLTFWSRPPASWACSTLRTLDGRSLALSLSVSARAGPDRGFQASAHCSLRSARRIAPPRCRVAAPR